MDKETDHTNSEYTGYSEKKLDKQTNLLKNQNIQGSILFSTKPQKKKKPFNWIRIRSFLIKHKEFKRLLEFSVHPSGIHLLHQAVFYSDNGCRMCKVYVEKNLF